MHKKISLLFSLSLVIINISCKNVKITKPISDNNNVSQQVTQAQNLPEPYATPSVNNSSKTVGWPAGLTPQAPPGFTVKAFAQRLDNPRWIYVSPNGDIFISMANTVTDGFNKTPGMGSKNNRSNNSVLIFRDANGDGIPELSNLFITGLNRPFGMLVLKDHFYVACTDGLWMYPYTTGQIKMDALGKKIADLPAGGYNNHWTRNIIANREGTKLFVSVGSGSNVAEHGIEHEIHRANILEFNTDGSGERVYASGLRNPVGMDWAPGTNTLWTAVNERDNLGDELVPDYATSVREGGFYGWPYAYFGANPDPRRKGEREDLVQKTIVPDLALGAHTASLGLTFNTKNNWGNYKNAMFIGQHGSWNRSVLSGYKVLSIPFTNGKPSGPAQDFLTGFIKDEQASVVYGRPVGVAFAKDGSLLVADDAGNTIWRITKN